MKQTLKNSYCKVLDLPLTKLIFNLCTGLHLQKSENQRVIKKYNIWKPYCVVSFNMGWCILVFYPKLQQGIKFTNILPTHGKICVLVICGHSTFNIFHFSCPVCRFLQTPEEVADNRCMTCGSQEVDNCNLLPFCLFIRQLQCHEH